MMQTSSPKEDVFLLNNLLQASKEELARHKGELKALYRENNSLKTILRALVSDKTISNLDQPTNKYHPKEIWGDFNNPRDNLGNYNTATKQFDPNTNVTLADRLFSQTVVFTTTELGVLCIMATAGNCITVGNVIDAFEKKFPDASVILERIVWCGGMHESRLCTRCCIKDQKPSQSTLKRKINTEAETIRNKTIPSSQSLGGYNFLTRVFGRDNTPAITTDTELSLPAFLQASTPRGYVYVVASNGERPTIGDVIDACNGMFADKNTTLETISRLDANRFVIHTS